MPKGRRAEGPMKGRSGARRAEQQAYGGGGGGGADEGEEDDGGGEGARVLLHRGRPGWPQARLALAFAAAGHGSRSRWLAVRIGDLESRDAGEGTRVPDRRDERVKGLRLQVGPCLFLELGGLVEGTDRWADACAWAQL